MPTLLDKFKGAILGLAIGDACGYPVDFCKTKEELLSKTNGKGVTSLPSNALYSDDTQLSICVADSILEAKDDIDRIQPAFAKHFVLWLKTQKDETQNRMPSNTCISSASLLEDKKSIEASGFPNAIDCGSTCRTAPIGLFHHKIEKIVDFSIESSRVSHLNEICLCGAAANALITRFAIDNMPTGQWANEVIKIASISEDFNDTIKMAARFVAEDKPIDEVFSEKGFSENWQAHFTIASALYCCMTFPDNYKYAVLMAANIVGKSDSIACLVGGWMGAKLGIEAIPQEWVSAIENKSKLENLAIQLFEQKM